MLGAEGCQAQKKPGGPPRSLIWVPGAFLTWVSVAFLGLWLQEAGSQVEWLGPGGSSTCYTSHLLCSWIWGGVCTDSSCWTPLMQTSRIRNCAFQNIWMLGLKHLVPVQICILGKVLEKHDCVKGCTLWFSKIMLHCPPERLQPAKLPGMQEATCFPSPRSQKREVTKLPLISNMSM